MFRGASTRGTGVAVGLIDVRLASCVADSNPAFRSSSPVPLTCENPALHRRWNWPRANSRSQDRIRLSSAEINGASMATIFATEMSPKSLFREAAIAVARPTLIVAPARLATAEVAFFAEKPTSKPMSCIASMLVPPRDRFHPSAPRRGGPVADGAYPSSLPQ